MSPAIRSGAPTGSTRALLAELQRSLPAQEIPLKAPVAGGPGEHRADEHLRHVMETLPEGVWSIGLPGLELLCANAAIERIFGYSRAEFYRNPHLWLETIHPEDRKNLGTSFRELLRDGQGEFEFLGIRADGELRRLRSRTWCVRDEHGRLLRIDGITTEVRTPGPGEPGLRNSARQLRRLIDHAADTLFIHDREGRIFDVNEQACRSLGYTRVELLSLHVEQIEVGTGADELHRLWRTAGRDIPMTLQGTHRRKDGTTFPVEVRLSRLNAEDDTFFVVVARDVSERRHLEEQLRQSQKMEAVGRLAGGVAHDFNNMLAVINGYSHLLLQMPETPETVRQHVAQIAQAGERAASLTRQLLAFSRRQVVNPRPLDLIETVQNLRRMLDRLIGEDVRLAVECVPETGRILADPSQIEQVLMNLVVNGRDAMPQGGSITIRTRNVPAGEGPSVAREAAAGWVALSVADSGVGMDPETVTRIFEPFFTTKPAGQGTGLGLATVYGIVCQNGGEIEVATDVGKGTTFTIYLPRLAGGGEASEAADPTADSHRGAETVLVVEDDPLVCRIAESALRSAGYAVLSVGSGPEALELLSTFSCDPDLVLTDVVMPEMSGGELAEELARRRPDLPILFMSGYNEDFILAQGLRAGQVELLSKPFTPLELARKVRAMLDRRHHARSVA